MATQTSVSGADRGREPGRVSPRAALETARDELRADTIQGAGGRAALERYTAHVDRLLHYATPADGAAIAFAQRNGFTEVTRTRRGWELPLMP